jgi:hypothetical protein
MENLKNYHAEMKCKRVVFAAFLVSYVKLRGQYRTAQEKDLKDRDLDKDLKMLPNRRRFPLHMRSIRTMDQRREARKSCTPLSRR